MKRRDFITLLGGAAAAWPFAGRAQQPMPVIGLVNSVSFESYATRVEDFRQGLKDAGFAEGQNVTIEYHSAKGDTPRLTALIADIIRRQVTVIVAIGSSLPARLAKAQTTVIPIVFAMGGDAIELGLVASLSRLEANVTGVSINSNGLGPKRLELLRELLPNATSIGFLTNSGLTISTAADVRNMLEAARTLGIQIIVLNAGTEREIVTAFANYSQQKVAALVLEGDPFFISQREQIAKLAASHAIPAIYPASDFIKAGGLIGYSPDLKEAYHQTGVYTGRILKGDKPKDLPVLQPTKFELIINMETAKALGLDIPPKLLALTTEVIE